MKKILKYFENFSDFYITNYLAHIDINKMSRNEKYAQKLFFYKWAFERSGAPKAYKITAAKTFHSLNGKDVSKVLKTFYSGKTNKNCNPLFDKNLNNIQFSQMTQLLQKNKIEEAFKQLKLKGIKHKIRAFYLRDIYYLIHLNDQVILKPEDYLYFFPVDIWVRLFASHLKVKKVPLTTQPISKYDLNKNDRELANGLIQMCINYNISPLKLNMGIWMYCANVISDQKRLKVLLKSGSVKNLKSEFNMLKDVAIWANVDG